MKHKTLLLPLLLLSFACFAQTGSNENAAVLSQAALKSVLVANFMQYVEWPESRTSPFRIGVVQDSVLAATLRQTNLAEHPKLGKVEVSLLSNLGKADQMHLLVCAAQTGYSANELLAAIERQPVLLVTEGYPYNSTMLNFVYDGNNLKYELNGSNLELQGLKGNSLLEKQADEVSEEDWRALLKSAREALSSETERRQELEVQNKEMMRDITELADRMMALRSEVTALESQIQREKEELNALRSEVAEERIHYEELKSELALKETALTENEARLRKSNEALEANAKKVAESEERLEQKGQMLKALNQEYADMEDRMNRVTAVLENQKLVNLILILIGLLISILAILAFINYRKQRKQAVIIAGQRDTLEQQHKELATKNQEILDSISYARRIQQAILPPHRIVKDYLEESFILYKPKDIVAGDFYWMRTMGDKVIFTAADCTGHGVPGALVSVVCSNALNRSVREFGLTEPAAILDKTLELVIERFSKSDEDVKDGMDIALCALNTKTHELEYAGAHNPLWMITKPGVHDELIENGGSNVRTHEIEGESYLLIEIKADKQPIGKTTEMVSYTPHRIQLEPGDAIYMFSDGYPDQFGGPKGKKFKYRSFKELLLSIYREPMDKQKDILDRTFEEWRGDLEQVDDVCVIGVRI